MVGLVWFVFWQALGIWLAEGVFSRYRQAVRVWLGSVCGTLLSMWAPIPFSFLWRFSHFSHTAALFLGIALAGVLFYRKRPLAKDAIGAASVDKDIDRPLRFLFIPFFLFSVILVLNHSIPVIDGAIYTGQCTYGDMCMHLGFISSLAEQQTFPPFYNILPSARICYPFLCDSVSASLYLLGTPLRWAYIVPMLFAFAQIYAGFWFLAREICRRAKAPILAFLFFFLNGGFGMIYFIKDYSLHDLFTGFYKTPTNLTEKGMRWVNVIADMLLPQRATLFGWAALLAVLFLLFRAVFRDDKAAWLPAGILGGLLPMIHTHSFFALGLMAICWLLYSLIRDGWTAKWFTRWCLFGIPAVLLAIPQLLIWTFRSVGGNESFLRLGFDWVNGGQENWFWFWLKNVGPLFVITPIAFLFGDREKRGIFSGAILIFVLCELVIFQPNIYDNNKLLYVSYFFCCFLSADAVAGWLEKMRSRALRSASLALLLLLTSNAAVFTLAREMISGTREYGYRLFSSDEVSAADYIMDNTEPDALFLTDDNHNNLVAVMTGRNIVCGSSSFLYYHGLDYVPEQQKAEAMLTNSDFFESNRKSSGIDYVYMGYFERSMAGNILPYLEEHYPLVFSSGQIMIFDVR